MRQFDDQIPGYIGRILSGHGDPVGTCFQVEPHVLVTAWHVVEQCGAGEVGSFVEVDSLSPGASPPSPAEVERIDPDHDLAVLRRELPLSASVEFFEATDTVSLAADVIVTGHSRVEDYGGHAPVAGGRRFLHALGTWTGGTVSDKGVALGRLSAPDVVLGMSGAPVRQLSDGAVVGMVCARYSSAGQWLPHAVWVTRIEDLRQLLAGMVDIAIPSPELQRVLQLVKDREDLYVYVKRLEIRRGEPGNQDARAIPVIYQQLREIYFDLGVLSGPDGPFPTAILPLAPAVADDPEALLGQILPRQPKPVLEPRIIKAIQARGSDIWDGTTFSLAALRLDPQGCKAIQARGSDIWDGTTFSLAALRLDPQGWFTSTGVVYGVADPVVTDLLVPGVSA